MYFLPLPHQHGAFRPNLFSAMALVTSAASLSLLALQCKGRGIGSSSINCPIGFGAVYNEVGDLLTSQWLRIPGLIVFAWLVLLGNKPPTFGAETQWSTLGILSPRLVAYPAGALCCAGLVKPVSALPVPSV